MKYGQKVIEWSNYNWIRISWHTFFIEERDKPTDRSAVFVRERDRSTVWIWKKIRRLPRVTGQPLLVSQKSMKGEEYPWLLFVSPKDANVCS